MQFILGCLEKVPPISNWFDQYIMLLRYQWKFFRIGLIEITNSIVQHPADNIKNTTGISLVEFEITNEHLIGKFFYFFDPYKNYITKKTVCIIHTSHFVIPD